MTKAIDSKLAKLAAKQAELQQQIAALEAQKKLAVIDITHPDLNQLQQLVEQTAEKLKTTPKKIVAILSAHAKGNSGSAKVAKVAVIKYRDTAPGNENNTWSGRGLAPLWLKRYEAAGRSRNDFLVTN